MPGTHDDDDMIALLAAIMEDAPWRAISRCSCKVSILQKQPLKTQFQGAWREKPRQAEFVCLRKTSRVLQEAR
jgi:tRNA(Phe) wybutosine-synthesizing methylase Tyw3